MSVEKLELSQSTDIVDEQHVEQHENSPIEEMARNYGWNPNEGEKSAEEFIKFALDELPNRGKALKTQKVRIDAKDRELSDMRIVLDQLTSDMKKQKDVAYRQAMDELKHNKQQAIAAGDFNTVEQIENQAAAINSQQQNDQQLVIQAAISDFQNRNADWYSGDDEQTIEMQGYARQIDLALMSKQLNIHDHLDRLETMVQRKFPKFFEVEQENNVGSVESVQHENNISMKKRDKKYTLKDLTPEQQLAANYLAKKGQMTVDEYIKSLISYGDLA